MCARAVARSGLLGFEHLAVENAYDAGCDIVLSLKKLAEVDAVSMTPEINAIFRIDQIYDEPKFVGYEVEMDVFAGGDPSRTVIAYGAFLAGRIDLAHRIMRWALTFQDPQTGGFWGSRGDPASRTDQRARAIGPVCGMVAPPAMPQANSTHTGASSMAAAARAVTDRTS